MVTFPALSSHFVLGLDLTLLHGEWTFRAWPQFLATPRVVHEIITLLFMWRDRSFLIIRDVWEKNIFHNTTLGSLSEKYTITHSSTIDPQLPSVCGFSVTSHVIKHKTSTVVRVSRATQSA